MARMPAGAELVENPISQAPGYRIGNVYVMAGVPIIMRAMFESIRHQLAGGAPVLSRTVGGAIGEGKLAARLGAIQARYANVDIGSYPFFRGGAYGVSLVLRSQNEDELEAATEEVRELIRSFGEEPYEGEMKLKESG
jgi:molybdopterin-biosynthesis enzyme MoeA-like protein